MAPTTATIYNAFTSSWAQGNPAAVIVLPPRAADLAAEGNKESFPYDLLPPTAQLQAVAKELNLAMTAFLVPLDPADARFGGAHYAVRWFNSAGEAPLCGHATAAMSEHLFNTVPDAPKTLKFLTRLHGIISASRQPNPLEEGDVVAIEFPELLNLPSVPKDSDRWSRLKSLFEAATSSSWEGDNEPLGVFEQDIYLLIEFKPELDLKSMRIDPEKLATLKSFAYMFQVSSNKTEHIHSRVVNTIIGDVEEDIATGSAHRAIIPHTLSNPETKARFQKHHPDHKGHILRAAQQSKEGGELVVEWLRDEKKVKIMGKVEPDGKREVDL